MDAIVATAENETTELLEVVLGDRRSFWFFAECRDSQLEAPQLDVTATVVERGYVVTVTSATLVRDLALLVDRLDPEARVDDQLVTLLPGESITFAVTSNAQIDADAWAGRTVLRSANQLVVHA